MKRNIFYLGYILLPNCKFLTISIKTLGAFLHMDAPLRWALWKVQNCTATIFCAKIKISFSGRNQRLCKNKNLIVRQKPKVSEKLTFKKKRSKQLKKSPLSNWHTYAGFNHRHYCFCKIISEVLYTLSYVRRDGNELQFQQESQVSIFRLLLV